ncbi:hypothetical protein G7Y79_00015g038260 [Physcia stellaris]|nr:hypothetical protein G7Y79_00015g038260 [Physcia stellaris]
MPTIEVLPTSTSISAPGWAYVPDTGYDPSKAPLAPTARKRAARTTALTGPNTISTDTRLATSRETHRRARPRWGGGSTSRPRAAAAAGTALRRASTAATASPPPPSVQSSARQAAVAVTPTSAKPTVTAAASAVAVQSDPEDDPLLKTYIPAPPSAAEMEALCSAPPLSYNQARAAPSVGKPQRYFWFVGWSARSRMMKGGVYGTEGTQTKFEVP